MIEITSVTLEECFIKLLQKTYPITISDIQRQLNRREHGRVTILAHHYIIVYNIGVNCILIQELIS